MEEIAERTDGVPLFVEELTKAVLESGARMRQALSSMPHPASAVPATLHASLMARLDRLGSAAKDVAQTGAAIGREFGYGLLASVTDLPEPQLREALDRLTNSGLLFVRGTPPDPATSSSTRWCRMRRTAPCCAAGASGCTARIAATLEERFPEIVLAQPALLAHHCTAAGLAEKAIGYWLKAVRQALARSAMKEAVVQSRKGLEVLADLPESPGRRQQELDLQGALAWGLVATSGWSAAEVGETLARVRALAEQLDRPEYLVGLIAGQWRIHLVRAEHRLALALGEQLENIGKTRNDTDEQSLGQFLQGASCFRLGEFVAARGLLEASIYRADPARRGLERMACRSLSR